MLHFVIFHTISRFLGENKEWQLCPYPNLRSRETESISDLINGCRDVYIYNSVTQ
jgi:hypothetical protein